MLLGVMAADKAAGAGTQQPVIASIVSGNAADDRALNATCGVRGRRRDAQRRDQYES
jgi:hypothetical protein